MYHQIFFQKKKMYHQINHVWHFWSGSDKSKIFNDLIWLIVGLEHPYIDSLYDWSP